MNYHEALDYIHGTYKFGSKLGLENIRYLLELMGNPHKNLKIIHVAGTNGKGSTCTFISQILIEEGYKVGLFTSPFLEEFTERIKINGENIPRDDLAKATQFVKSKVELMLSQGKNHPTEFEIVTAIAFHYYNQKQVDYVVLEVGLGGRLDSTNVVENTLVSVITPIDFDHIQYLGDTIDKIAYEKAGIIKNNSYVVVHPQLEKAMESIEKVCSEKESELFIAPTDSINIKKYDEHGITFDVDVFGEKFHDMNIRLLGRHQAGNSTVTLAAIKVLRDYHNVKVSKESILKGMKKAVWPGRLEVLRRNPTLLIDGAHNLQGARVLKNTIKEIFKYKRLIGVIGILEDKDVDGILKELIPLCDKVITTKPNSPRALSAAKLAGKIVDLVDNIDVISYERISDAVQESLKLAEKDDLVLYCGSLYMIGEIRTILTRQNDG